MCRIVTIGHPPTQIDTGQEDPIDLAVTFSELGTFLGVVWAAGIVQLVLNNDAAIILAAGMATIVVMAANHNPGKY